MNKSKVEDVVVAGLNARWGISGLNTYIVVAYSAGDYGLTAKVLLPDGAFLV